MSKLIELVKEIRLINKIESKEEKIKALNELKEKAKELKSEELNSQKENIIKMINNYEKNTKRGFDPLKKTISELWESDK